MANLFFLPDRPVFSPNGAPVSGALAYFYLTGTSTPAPIYTDAALSIEHANPVVADANGVFPPIYLDDDIVYRLVITGALGEASREYDPYTTLVAGALTSPFDDGLWDVLDAPVDDGAWG